MKQEIIEHIPLNGIIASDNIRSRYDEEKVVGLSQSMRESGLREPIHVIPLGGERYKLLTGARRLRAARKAGWDTVPAIVEQADLSRADVLVLQIIENVQREDLSPIEKAKAIDALIRETGWTASQTASKLGLSNGTVSKLLSLLSLPDALQQRIEAGDLPASAAYELTTLNDTETRNQLADKVASGELTRDELSDAIKATKRRQRRPRKLRPTRVTAKLESCQTVSVSAVALDLTSFVVILEKLLNHAQQARSDGLTLDALLKQLAKLRSTAVASTRAA